ncbi:MAG: hypothetical protein ACRCYZ_04945 [Alphaproteobacteria bacterium]
MLKKELIYYLIIACMTNSSLEAMVSQAALKMAANELSHETKCLLKAHRHVMDASHYIAFSKNPNLRRDRDPNNGNASSYEISAGDQGVYEQTTRMNTLPQRTQPSHHFDSDELDPDPSKKPGGRTISCFTYKNVLIVLVVVLCLLGLGGLAGFFSHHLVSHSNNSTSEVFPTSTLSPHRISTQENLFFTTERVKTSSKPKFSGIRWTDMRKQFECKGKDAYEGQQCWMRFDGTWHESPVTASDPYCFYTQKISCPDDTQRASYSENLELQDSDCWLKKCPGEKTQGEIWGAGQRFQISYQYDWKPGFPHAGNRPVVLPENLRDICKDQIEWWKKDVLGLRGNDKPYLIHASIRTISHGDTQNCDRSCASPSTFTANNEVVAGNIWMHEDQFYNGPLYGGLQAGTAVCTHEFGHFFSSPGNPRFAQLTVRDGSTGKNYFVGDNVVKFLGQSWAPLDQAGAHWALNMIHPSTGKRVILFPMQFDISQPRISDLNLWTLEDMGVETTVSKNRNQGLKNAFHSP